MTIEERIETCTREMNAIQQQAESIDKQIAQLQSRRESLVQIYRRHEGALAVLQDIKAEQPAPAPEDQS